MEGVVSNTGTYDFTHASNILPVLHSILHVFSELWYPLTQNKPALDIPTFPVDTLMVSSYAIH